MAGNDRPPGEHDPTRREFFRTFGRETARQAGALVGAAAELRRSGLAAANELMDTRPAPTPTLAAAASPTTPEWNFRSAYRFTGDAIVLLDQRELPGRVSTVGVREPSEVASAIRFGLINGGPVLAEVAAYAMVLAATTAAARPSGSREQLIRAAAGTLRAARGDVRALAWAVDLMEARYDELAEMDPDSSGLAEALHDRANAIATDSMAAMATIGRAAADGIARDGAATANLLMHGDTGPLSCGMIGMGTSLAQALSDAGRAVHVWLTEALPSGEGARIAAFQLAQLEIPHTVIPDSALGWLFDRRRLDAVLLRGDRICQNGDTGVIIGGLTVARLARAAGVPVMVLAPTAAIDPALEDGTAMGSDLRSAAETLAEARPSTSDEAAARPAVFGVRLDPPFDVLPAALIDRLVTEASA